MEIKGELDFLDSIDIAQSYLDSIKIVTPTEYLDDVTAHTNTQFLDYIPISQDIKQDIKPDIKDPITKNSLVNNILDSTLTSEQKLDLLLQKDIPNVNKTLKENTPSILTTKAVATTAILSACVFMAYASGIGMPVAVVSTAASSVAKYYFNNPTDLLLSGASQVGWFLGDICTKAGVENYFKNVGHTTIISENVKRKLQQLGIPESVYAYTYNNLINNMLGNIVSGTKLGISLYTGGLGITVASLLIPKVVGATITGAVGVVKGVGDAASNVTSNIRESMTAKQSKIEPKERKKALDAISYIAVASNKVEASIEKSKLPVGLERDSTIEKNILHAVQPFVSTIGSNVKNIELKTINPELKSISTSLTNNKLALLASASAVSLATILLSGSVDIKVTGDIIKELIPSFNVLEHLPTISPTIQNVTRKTIFSMFSKYIGFEKVLLKYGKVLTTDQLKNINALNKKLELGEYSQKFFDILLGNKIYSQKELLLFDKTKLKEIAKMYSIKESEKESIIENILELQKEKQKVTYNLILECCTQNMISIASKVASMGALDYGYKNVILPFMDENNKLYSLIQQTEFKLSDAELAALKVATGNKNFDSKYLVSGGILTSLKEDELDPVSLNAINALKKINLFLGVADAAAISAIPLLSKLQSYKLDEIKLQEAGIKKGIDDILLKKAPDLSSKINSITSKMDKLVSQKLNGKPLLQIDAVGKEYKILTGIKAKIDDLISKIDDTDVPTGASVIDKQKILDGLIDVENQIAVQFREYEKSLEFLKSQLERFMDSSIIAGLSVSLPNFQVPILQPMIQPTTSEAKFASELKSTQLPPEIEKYLDYKFTPILRQLTLAKLDSAVNTFIPGIGYYNNIAKGINTAQDVLVAAQDVYNIKKIFDSVLELKGEEIQIPERHTGIKLPEINVVSSLLSSGIIEKDVKMLDIVRDTLLDQFRRGYSQDEFMRILVKKMLGEGEIDLLHGFATGIF